MKTPLKALCAAFVFACAAKSAPAALVLTYEVNIVQSGPVTVGDTIDWQIFATVSGAPDVGSNFGIANLSVDLTDSAGDVLSPGTVGPDFVVPNYDFQSGGIPSPPDLTFISALDLVQGSTTVGDAPGSFLLASGSYTVSQVGLHTLQALQSVGEDSLYFTAAGQAAASASLYDQVVFGSDTVEVLAAVPEPASLAMMGVAVCGAIGLRRRRKIAPGEQAV